MPSRRRVSLPPPRLLRVIRHGVRCLPLYRRFGNLKGGADVQDSGQCGADRPAASDQAPPGRQRPATSRRGLGGGGSSPAPSRGKGNGGRAVKRRTASSRRPSRSGKLPAFGTGAQRLPCTLGGRRGKAFIVTVPHRAGARPSAGSFGAPAPEGESRALRRAPRPVSMSC